LLPIVVVALSAVWVLFRPDLWPWAVCFAALTITLLRLAHSAGLRQGRESALNAQPIRQESEKNNEKSEAEARLEAYETALLEVDLFAYELKHGLVPDGNSEENPGYGPMDFNEWQEWKHREFERTGNLWHNHPGGLPPREGDAA
jgi:hypothetical protein